MTTLSTIIKSPSDNRTYKAIKLANELECVLIQDVDALKSSAALSVGVGSFKDPITSQGLAHYLEHMLFMGTAKYPDENEYSNVSYFLFSSLLKMEEVTTPILPKKRPITCLRFPAQSLSKLWTGLHNFSFPP